MTTDPPKQGLFSSLTLGRESRTPKPSAETLTHPLLGRSTSSLNLNDDNAEAGPSQPTNRRQTSWSTKTGPTEALNNLPYRPRQRHGGGVGSTGNASSVIAPSPNLLPATVSISSSTPTSMPTPPTTFTSTSATFALPLSASDSLAIPEAATTNLSASPGSTSATSRLQLQSLKAAAQRIGLGNGSMGMSMIDAIFDKSQVSRVNGNGGEWGDLLKVLMFGKVGIPIRRILLLLT